MISKVVVGKYPCIRSIEKVDGRLQRRRPLQNLTLRDTDHMLSLYCSFHRTDMTGLDCMLLDISLRQVVPRNNSDAHPIGKSRSTATSA